MPPSRRSLLIGTAGALAAFAGCNDTSNVDRTTVTPVNVPKTKGEALQEAAEIERPDIPSAVRVTDDHLAAAIADAETLVSDLRSAIARSEDIDLSEFQRRLPDDPEEVVERAESQLESVREATPSKRALSTVKDVVEDVALVVGYIEAKLGELDHERLEAELRDEEAATEALADRFSYRIVRPLAEYLPTLRLAETTRPTLADLEDVREPVKNLEADNRTTAAAFGLAYRELEAHRRDRRETANLLATATDEDTPSVRPAIDDALSDLREEVEAIADMYDDQDLPGDVSVEGEIRNIRVHVGRRSQQWRSRLEEYDGTRQLDLLLNVSEWLVEFEALDAAVGRTTDALDDNEIPSDAIVAAKRDAVDSLKEAVEGTALQRSFAERCGILLQTADRNGNSDARTVARTYLLYTAVDEWSQQARERGKAVADALQAQQS